METYLVKFLDKRGIARINICSEACQEIVCVHYMQKNAQLFKELVKERLERPGIANPRSNYLEEVTKVNHNRFSISPCGSREHSPNPEEPENILPLPPRGILPSPQEKTLPLQVHRLPRPGPSAGETDSRFKLPPRGIHPSQRRELTQAEKQAAGLSGHQQRHLLDLVPGDYKQQPEESRDSQIYGRFTFHGIMIEDEEMIY